MKSIAWSFMFNLSINTFDHPQEIRNVSKSQECQKECLPDCQKTAFTFTGPYTDSRYYGNWIFFTLWLYQGNVLVTMNDFLKSINNETLNTDGK